jgi:hypothetical protein
MYDQRLHALWQRVVDLRGNPAVEAVVQDGHCNLKTLQNVLKEADAVARDRKRQTRSDEPNPQSTFKRQAVQRKADFECVKSHPTLAHSSDYSRELSSPGNSIAQQASPSSTASEGSGSNGMSAYAAPNEHGWLMTPKDEQLIDLPVPITTYDWLDDEIAAFLSGK